MIHMGQSFSPMRAILPLLKRGDVVTHMYAPPPNGILDEEGRLFTDVAAARRRGVIFDLGHGGNLHFSWEVVERATKQGFWPDTLSTDWTARETRRRRLPERHVEVHHARHAPQPSDRVRDRQCSARFPGLR
jgi:dihydroorotase